MRRATVGRSGRRWSCATRTCRWSYGELRAASTIFAAGLLALGLAARRPHRHLVAQQRRMGADPVRHRQGRPDPGQHQSGLSRRRARIRAQQGRLQGADPAPSASRPRDYLGMLRELAPELARGTPGKLRSRAPAGSARGHRTRRIGSSPACCTSTTFSAAAARPKRTRLAELAPELQFDDPINIQFTSRHDRVSQGRDAQRTTTSSTTASSSAKRCGSRREDRLCIPVPLYHCFGMVLGNLGCLTHGAAMVYPAEGFDPLATLRPSRRSAARRSTACRPCSSPQLDHPRVRQLRSVDAAHRHHGGLAVPDRGDEARGRPDAHERDHHRLRHDRDEPGQLPELDRRSAGAPRLDGRPHPAASRGQDRRCATAASCRAGTPGELLHARLFGDARLLGRRGKTARGDRRRRAGCTPATSRPWTTRATSTSSAASRTW